MDVLRAVGALSLARLAAEKLVLGMIETARLLSRVPHASWTDRPANRDCVAGCHPPGGEIRRRTSGRVQAPSWSP